MATILDEIVASKQREITASRTRMPQADLERLLPALSSTRDFRAALEAQRDIAVIAEVKKASPSAGLLRLDFDPVAIAKTYERHGAACISVLTDGPFFQGSLGDLRATRQAVAVPLLRKDFIVDPYQLLEARASGADAALLIAEILSDRELRDLQAAASDLGLQTLVELHDAANLTRVLDSGARLIGVNNRDLRTFATRLETTIELAGRMPQDACLVSESGIRTRADLERLRAAGVRAVLVGETLMRASDVGTQLDVLLGHAPDGSER
jgi:indole-3-glycerol phosphate synthase